MSKSFIIKRFKKENKTTKKLVEMGLTPGERVTIERIAPFGDPYILKVRSYQLAVRKIDMKDIVLVECKG